MQAFKTLGHSIYNHVRRSRSLLVGVAIGVGLATGAPTMADEIDEVGKLISQGQYDQALSRADTYLANRPNDAQMRFMKGIVLTERNRTAEAIAIFAKLTEDYPELPEPYNNLAVLYAGRGEYDKARTALEMAIRTHPSYATAHENLGDVYAKLASQSYDKALQLDGRNSTAQTKLALVRNLIGNKPTSSAEPTSKNRNTAASPASTTAAPIPPMAAVNPSPSKPATKPSVEKLSSEKPTPQSSSSAFSSSAPSSSIASASSSAPANAITSSSATVNTSDNKRTSSLPPISTSTITSATSTASESVASLNAKAAALSASSAPTKPVNNTIGVDSQVLQAVERWAKAWSDQNMKVYLESYSKDFSPPGNMNRSNWEKMRQQRIVGRENIRVAVDNPLITITGNQAVVKFRQNYFSDRLNNVSQKVLDMKLENGQWRIASERVGG